MSNPVTTLRTIGLVEAVSFLVLLGVAIPLKYLAGMPTAVRLVGWVHGVLFVVFCVALARATLTARWPLARSAILFGAALLPFGPFAIDRRLRAWAAEAAR